MSSTLRVGTFTRSLLLALARSDGALARAGLEVDEVSVTSSPGQFASLEAGEFDVVVTSPDNVLAYRFLANNPLGRNLPVEIICALDRGLGLTLALAPTTTSVEDVRGRAFGVDVAQSGFAFVGYALLERAGLVPGDYDVVALGSTPRRAQALAAGQCAATILNAGNDQRALGAGCTLVASVDVLGPYLGGVLAALTTDDAEARLARERFADALVETARSVLDERRESDVVDAAMAVLDLTEPEARAHYRTIIDPTNGLIADGRVDRASVATLVDLRRRFLPAPELDAILDSLGEVVLARAMG